MTICQTDLTLTLNCVIPSKWVESCPKLVFSTHSADQMKKQT